MKKGMTKREKALIEDAVKGMNKMFTDLLNGGAKDLLEAQVVMCEAFKKFSTGVN